MRGDFEQAYAADGSWVQLFRRADGFVQTRLLRDNARDGRYLTLDTWGSEAAYRAFLTTYADDYALLDQRCAGLTEAEVHLGYFSE